MRGKRTCSRPSCRGLRITPAGAGKTGGCSHNSRAHEDHPRRCGENRCSPPHSMPPAGSPPQVRGKRLFRFIGVARRRITPAGAGKTLRTGRGFQPSWDHPRRCGENVRVSDKRQHYLGSPPQVRGKQRQFRSCRHKGRITPAGAGKTEAVLYTPQRLEDHPRGCGENLPIFARDIADYRITPADAGKTFRQIYSYRIGQDHPRGCGENTSRRYCRVGNLGSPPRMRGKPQHTVRQELLPRITPADAGKTMCGNAGQSSTWDHPRGCGENGCTPYIASPSKGSPPRMRGKPGRSECPPSELRITPADAGKTN